MEMGFAENEVEDALRLHNNNQSAACDWLLGDRSNRPSTNPDQSEAAIQGLDVDSSLYEAIMTNPIVQQGLNNTRCLHAFLSMLENPTTTTHYLNDTEVIIISKYYGIDNFTIIILIILELLCIKTWTLCGQLPSKAHFLLYLRAFSN